MRSIFTVLAALAATFAAPIKEPRISTIPNQWLVKLHDGASSGDLQTVIANMSRRFGRAPDHVYDFGNFKAFSINGAPVVATALNSTDAVALVEPDKLVRTNKIEQQTDATYGLARISHRKPGFSTYQYDSSAGQGTFAYVIDTGIYLEHSDFEDRAISGADFTDDEPGQILNGHGTHVAGTIGGKTFGVAKNTTLIAVKVLGGEDGVGSISGVIAGLDYAVQDAKNNSRIDKSVANLSLGSDYSDVMNAAVRAAVEEGLFVAVAAGNSGKDASLASPASEPLACTIGAIDANDTRPDFSNFGPLLDLFAPGVDVQSAWILGPDSSAFLSGTSMASPHVAGVGAYLLGFGDGRLGGNQLCQSIKRLSTKRAVVNAGEGSVRKVAFNDGGKKPVVSQPTVKGQGQTWGKV